MLGRSRFKRASMNWVAMKALPALPLWPSTQRMFGFDGLSVLAWAAGTVPAPIPTPLGQLWLDPATMVVDPATLFVPSTGIATRTLSVPNVAALRNRTLYLQALHFAPQRSWFRLTNMTKLTFR